MKKLFISTIFIFVLLPIFTPNSSGFDQIEKKEQLTTDRKNLDFNIYLSEKNSTDKKNDSGGDVLLSTYLIALAILGFFNMYNALEIFKKKELLDKEFNEITLKFNKHYSDLIDQKNILTHEYNTNISKLKENMDKTNECIRLNNEKLASDFEAINKKIKLNEIKSNEILLQFNMHSYRYYIQSLVPLFIEDEINRETVRTAIKWLSQHGQYYDLLILENKYAILKTDNKDDVEMITLFDDYIKELKRQLASNT